jgi:hypothetical protein
VRDVRGEPHRVPAFPAELVLEQMAGTARHLHPTQPRLVADRQVPPGRVGGDTALPGVWDGHRDRVEGHRQPDSQPLQECAGRGGEPPPLQIRFQAGEEQERRPRVVVQRVQPEHRVLVVLPVVLHEGHGRSSGPVVEQLIHVKGRDETVIEAGQQVVGGEAHGPAGIHDPGEGLQQDGSAQLRQLANDLVQVTRIEHWSRPPHRTSGRPALTQDEGPPALHPFLPRAHP